MALLPKTNKDLNYLLNSVEVVSKPRTYLGMSQIGDPCHRALQYYHYWAFNTIHSKRMLRLFGVGHRMEDTFIQDLQSVGFEFESHQSELIGTAGHWKGHDDGIAISPGIMVGDYFIEKNVRILTEFKTHNDKSFKELLRDGLKKSKPGHYGQIQEYLDGHGLYLCLYAAYNKNDSTYHFEVVEKDEEYCKDMKRKEMEVIASDSLLPRIGTGKETWYECKFCDARKVCFKKEDVLINCRTCQHIDVLDNGVWECSFHAENEMVGVAKQRKGCEHYQLADMFKE